MNNITNIICYIVILAEIAIIIITYYYLKNQYKYAVYCYKKNSQKPFFVERKDNDVENIIVSNMTQKIDVEEIDDKISIPILRFRLDGQENVEIPINDERIFIGRSKSDDIIINDPTISRNQCMITKEDGQYFINIDINKNPIQLNKKQISNKKEKPYKEELSNGDIVSLGNGRVSFQFVIPQNLAII